jgi:hypothetical protein
MRIERGDEVGMFHLGSTAVVLIEKRAAVPWLASEGPVRLGEALLRERGADQAFEEVLREERP